MHENFFCNFYLIRQYFDILLRELSEYFMVVFVCLFVLVSFKPQSKPLGNKNPELSFIF